MSELAKALAKFQRDMPSARMSGRNPHFRSKYATLDDIMNVVKTNNVGLSVTSSLSFEGEEISITTTMWHESGESISSTMPIILDKKNMQSFGSAISYAKRYSIASLFGIVADEDDDGNAASLPQRRTAPSASPSLVEPPSEGPGVAKVASGPSELSDMIAKAKTQDDLKHIYQINQKMLRALKDSDEQSYESLIEEFTAKKKEIL